MEIAPKMLPENVVWAMLHGDWKDGLEVDATAGAGEKLLALGPEGNKRTFFTNLFLQIRAVYWSAP